MRIVPGQKDEDEAAITPEVLVLDEAALRAVTDPWERARLAAELATHLQQRATSVSPLLASVSWWAWFRPSSATGAATAPPRR
jgi:hypothetical protein